MILTRKRLPTLGLALLFLAATATGAGPTVATFFDNGVTAHRGNSAEYPENTIPAFKSGIEFGADWIELDVFRTQDGKLVVIHDRTTGRVGDKNLVVPDSTYEQLLPVDIATEFRNRHGKSIETVPRHTIPLLREVLLLVMTQTRTRVSIQPKMDCVAEAVALVKELGAERWVGFNDGNLQYMAEVKRLAPGIPVFWDRTESDIDEDIRIAKRLGFETLVLHQVAVTQQKIEQIHQAGIKAGVWTVNDETTMAQMLKMGIDRVYTDEPRRLLALKSTPTFDYPHGEGTGRTKERQTVPLIFDTDMMGDVDDVGTAAVLHSLANRGEATILAMGVCVKNPWSPLCLDALNTYFRRPEIPLGVVKGPAHNRASKYAQGIAEEFPHALKSAEDAPDAALVYRRVLAGQPDGSVVMVSVGQLTNFRNLLKTGPDDHSNLGGVELVERKVRVWVCMGGKFPEGREANLINDGPAAAYAIEHWPTPIVFSGWEIGQEIMTGAGLRKAPEGTPVRRAYELYNGLNDRQSWDQTAVLYAVRGLDGGLADFWNVVTEGYLHVSDDGSDAWRTTPDKDHTYLVRKMDPKKIAAVIEELMLRQP